MPNRLSLMQAARETDVNWLSRPLGFQPRFAFLPSETLDSHELMVDSGEKAVRKVNDEQSPSADKRLAVVLLEPFECVELFAIVVKGERRAYFLDADEAEDVLEAHNLVVAERDVDAVARLEAVNAYLPAPKSGISVGSVYESDASMIDRARHERECGYGPHASLHRTPETEAIFQRLDEEQSAAGTSSRQHATRNGQTPKPSCSKRS